MPWMSDEQYMLFSDSRDKKSIAASAHKQRTHCGKGGGVKFPSDYLSKKEIKAMSGECKTYRMNEPLTWEEFTEWSNEHKVTYIQNIRERFGASDRAIAGLFEVSALVFGMWIKDLGLEPMNECGENWDRDIFHAWRTNDWADPMTWTEFKNMSDDKKKSYIQWIREQFNVPDSEIGEMLGVSKFAFGRTIRDLGMGLGRGAGKKAYDREAWENWKTMNNTDEEIPVEEVPVEETADIPEVEEPVEEITSICIPEDQACSLDIREKKRVVPKSGTMTFEGDIDDILDSIRLILEGNQVEVTMSWTVKE